MRIIAAILVFVLLSSCAAAAEIQPEAAEEKLHIYMPANMEPEEHQAFVEMLFAAVVGTTAEDEKEIRSDMTKEAIEERNIDNAAYRARTLPWLIAAFRAEISSQVINETAAPEPVPEVTPSPEELPVYTTEDSYAAFSETKPGMDYLALLESLGGKDMEMCMLITQEICQAWMSQVDHAKLMEMNGDYRCWIYAPGTQIDYPIVQCGDNNHYLKRMFNGERNSAGTLFIDYRNLSDFQDPNTLIYGHHMRNDSMFGTLTDYAAQTYFEGHPIMLMMSPKEIFLLEIFAGYTTSDKDHCYDIAISDEEDMAAFIGEALRKSDFVSGVQVGTTDRLVTLSTCAYAFDDARYILIGRIVPVWDIEMEAAVETSWQQPIWTDLLTGQPEQACRADRYGMQ